MAMRGLYLPNAEWVPEFKRELLTFPAGNRANSIRLNGVSGGAVINIGNLAKPEILAENQDPTSKLAGLFIEFYKAEKAIVATRIQSILAAIEQPGN